MTQVGGHVVPVAICIADVFVIAVAAINVVRDDCGCSSDDDVVDQIMCPSPVLGRACPPGIHVSISLPLYLSICISFCLPTDLHLCLSQPILSGLYIFGVSVSLILSPSFPRFGHASTFGFLLVRLSL